MSKHYEMRFSGTGGQGMMLMGDVMALSAGLKGGNEILLLKSYGPEARGGACRSELIYDADSVNYPALVKPDFVLAMSQLACDSYTGDMNKEEGILLIDSDLVPNVPADVKNVYKMPITEIAREATGKIICANVVALGAISVLCEDFTPEAVKECVLDKLAPKLHEMNIKAFDAGVAAAKALK